MKRMLLVTLALLLLGSAAEAVPTRVVVRARARDAKFIGSAVGALVVMRDAETGEVLAKGFTSGGTGNTHRIMVEPARRGVPITDETTAKFETVVDLREPTLVTIEVRAPYAQRQSTTTTSSQVWLIPGKDVVGEGIVIDVYGFSVGILSPQPYETVKLAGGSVTVPLRANVMMMCGCPVTPNGLWDATKYEVRAVVKRNGTVSRTVPLLFAGKPSAFEAKLEIPDPGTYEVTVYAFDPATGNAGVDRTMFTVAK